jgi:nitrogen fixation protein FixH
MTTGGEAMARHRADGWWYPWTFVAGMALVIAVNIALAIYAVGTFPGLETDDAYRKGLEYNETLAAARAQEALGWSVDVRYAPRPAEAAAEGRREGELVVTFLDKTGQPLRDLQVEAAMVRPTRAGLDMRIKLEPRGLGEYRAEAALPLAGQWDIRVLARRAHENFQATRRILVR